MLPTHIIEPSRKNPKWLIIYGKAKCGKTTAVSKLKNTLVLDFEKGSDFISALKVKVIGLNVSPTEKAESKVARLEAKEGDRLFYLNEIAGLIRKHRKDNNGARPYKRIVIDTCTKLEEMCEEMATLMYMNTAVGAKFNRDNDNKILPKEKWETVLTLPMGLGYHYLRQTFKEWISVIEDLADDIILICHVKDKTTNKAGKEVTSNDLYLTGRIAQIVAANSDAIGYMYRKKNQTFINFAGADDTCGSRCDHLRGKEILIMEETTGGKVESYWNNIYLDDTTEV